MEKSIWISVSVPDFTISKTITLRFQGKKSNRSVPLSKAKINKLLEYNLRMGSFLHIFVNEWKKIKLFYSLFNQILFPKPIFSWKEEGGGDARWPKKNKNWTATNWRTHHNEFFPSSKRSNPDSFSLLTNTPRRTADESMGEVGQHLETLNA